MTMHTEQYCTNLELLDPVAAIRAIQQAHLQLAAVNSGNYEPAELDNAPALAALHELLKAVGHTGHATDRPEPQEGEGIRGINVRFFAHVWDDENGLDLQEVSESTFTDLGGSISYERNSVFENGCRQICLTTDSVIEE